MLCIGGVLLPAGFPGLGLVNPEGYIAFSISTPFGSTSRCVAVDQLSSLKFGSEDLSSEDLSSDH
jgi:hypothetical protein